MQVSFDVEVEGFEISLKNKNKNFSLCCVAMNELKLGFNAHLSI